LLRYVRVSLLDRIDLRIDAALYCYRRSSVVCLSVGRSVCHDREPCKNGWTDRGALWRWTWVVPMNHVLNWVQIPTRRGILEGGKWRPIVKYSDSAVSWAKTAELIEMPFGTLSRVGQGNIYYRSVHWRNLANTIQPLVCSVDAALCQITVKLLW